MACLGAPIAACNGGSTEATNDGAQPAIITGGAAGSGSGGKGGASGSSGTGASAGSGGAAGTLMNNPPEPVGLVIVPSTSAIDLVAGAGKPVQLVAKTKNKDGSIGPAVSGAAWEVDFGDLATVDKNGLVTATGSRGGLATVVATYMTFKGTATVSVKLTLSVNTGKLSDPDIGKLVAATTPDPLFQWLYPYDGTVFPRGLAAPRLMWGAATGQKLPAPGPMMVSLKGEFADVATYVVATGAEAIIDPALWTKLTESGTGGPVDLKVSRLDTATGKATVVTQQKWRIASGNLRGTVYYWANSLGRVVRIKPGASAPDDFLNAAGVTDGCTTCHAVSANGTTLTLGGGEPSDSKASVFDLVGGKVSASNRGRAWAMLALTPDGTLAALNNAPLPGAPGLDGGFYNVASGKKVTGSGFDTELFDMPSFSPDGSRLAYVDHGTKGLVSLAFSAAGGMPKGMNKVALVPASGDPKTNAIAFPVLSPDGKWAVYHRGALDTREGPGDLVAASSTVPGAELPLDALNGAKYPFGAGDRDRHFNYEPTFMPVASGGYFWIVYTSRRTLGNQLTAVKTIVKQLWVAAFDSNATPGKDPSHPGFWVAGQDLATLNMRAYWALDPCKDDGKSCSAASECCNGACLSTGVCGHPPGQMCAPDGGLCKVPADCCGAASGVECINSHCANPTPK